MTFFWLVLIGIALLVPYGSAQSSTYTITAPNTIFPNTNYRIALSNHGSGANSQAIKADVRVVGQETSDGKLEGNAVSANGVITVSAKTTKDLVLKIGNWKPGSYRLEVNGTGGATFFRTIALNLNDKKFSIFIQTDKAIYQFGQIVHFRVVTVNSKLLPYKNGKLLVYITDGQDNRIKQWSITVPQSGIFDNELKLSDQPVKGIWYIYANIGDQTSTRSFEVTEYTLPRFDVTVEPPPYITVDTIHFPITVNAEYTFGGAVSGSYLVNVTETYCTYAWATSCQSRPVVLKGNFKGKVTVTVNVGDLYLTKSSYYGGSFTVLAIVSEEFTGITRNSTAVFQRYEQGEKLTIEQESSFKPHLPYIVTVRLQQQNNVPVTNATGKLNATVTYDMDLASNNFSIDFKNDGSATFTVVPPTDATSLSVEATYKALSIYGSASLAPSLSDKFITISVENTKPKVGDTLRVNVASTFTLVNPISYQVVGRGNIQIAKTIQLATTKYFTFVLNKSMAPHARIVVFYVTDCGEIVGDSLDISIDGAFQNNVTLHLSNTTAEPGNDVTITVSSSPNSLVLLNSVDKSVLLLRAGNDITKEMVINEIQQYDIGTATYYDTYDAGIIRRPGGGSFDEIFTLAGLVLLTNGLYYKAASCYGGPIYFAKGGISPVAMDAAVGGAAAVQPTYVRKYFPEVWIWENVTTKSNGKYDLKLKVPDTITTWEINGFALSTTEGLGLTDRPSNVVVTLNKTGNVSEYDIVEDYTTKQSQNSISKSVKIASNDVQVVTFRIRPIIVDYIDLNVKAVSSHAGDALITRLLVKAEGSPQYYNKAVFLDLRNSSTKSYSTSIDISIPKEAVPDSQFIEVAAMGDIMAPVIANIKNLLRMPSGCGEQNMINFAPDVVILRYLERINDLSQEFRTTAISYLETGYQTQLTYKHPDGSFSAFGLSDNDGSTWLTAFVVKSFVKAEKYITIDPNVIKQAKDFIVSKQLPDGQFKEDGRVLHKALQGGSSSTSIALTAYLVIAFLEDKDQNNADYTDSIKKAVTYLETKADSIDNIYDLIITTYALHLANSSKKDQLFERMNAKKITEGDLVHWTYPVPKPNGSDWYYDIPASYDIEITAYAELVNILRGLDIGSRLPCIRWLISQRSDLGGFSSSQDSVIGIQALGEDAPAFATTKNAKLELIVTYLNNETITFTLNKENSLVLQKAQLPKEVRSVRIKATGNGVGIFQVSWNYNIVKAGSSSSPSFVLNPVVTRTNDRSYSLRICSWYLLNDTTNMVVLELNTLSGYTLDIDTLPAAGFVNGIKRVDTSKSNTLAQFYFEFLPKTPNTLCITVNANKLTDVEELKDAMISVYDYYENSKRAEAFYNLPKETTN